MNLRKPFIPSIEAMGSLFVAVASRWIMGWPERVAALFAADTPTSMVLRRKQSVKKQYWQTSRTCVTLRVMRSNICTRFARRHHGNSQLSRIGFDG